MAGSASRGVMKFRGRTGRRGILRDGYFATAETSGVALGIIPVRTAGCLGAVAALSSQVKRAVARLGVAAVTIGCLAFAASCV